MVPRSPNLPPRKSLVIFVHGFNSDPTCWDTLLKLMSEDPVMTSAFDWKRFSYDSKITSGFFNLLARLPDYDDITAKFDQFLVDSFDSTYDQLYLVGHSQGGLIIQSWLSLIVTSNQANIRLKRVREIILVCTPTMGSTIASGLRKFVFSLLRDPQEDRLQVLDATVAKTRRLVEERIVQTSLRDASHWTVPILSIWGQGDAVVSATSAQASFDNLLTVDGDHSTVLKPANTGDSRYRVLADALLSPLGHRHVFEIDRYETAVTVQPLEIPNYEARRGDRVETKTSDNFATVQRTAAISAGNRCTDLFRFNYLTGSKGFIEAAFDEVDRPLGDAPPANEAPGDMRGRWLRGENDVIYDFRPVAGRTYTYGLRIWSGFDEGRRDVHFHFEGSMRCKEYVVSLDLSAYTSKGWRFTRAPELYIDPFGTAEHQIGEQRLSKNLQLPQLADATAGKWTWSFLDFSGGIVDAVWDLAPPS